MWALEPWRVFRGGMGGEMLFWVMLTKAKHRVDGAARASGRRLNYSVNPIDLYTAQLLQGPRIASVFGELGYLIPCRGDLLTLSHPPSLDAASSSASSPTASFVSSSDSSSDSPSDSSSAFPSCRAKTRVSNRNSSRARSRPRSICDQSAAAPIIVTKKTPLPTPCSSFPRRGNRV